MAEAKADITKKEAPAKKSVAELLADAPVVLAPAAEAGDGKKKTVKKSKRSVPKARACIFAGENNTIITITDLDGKALAWASAGSSGFKGARKSTPYAAKVAAERAMTMVLPFGVQNLMIEVRGIGPGREQAIRGLQLAGITFDQIKDTTSVAHGGCRPPKPRRV